MTTINDMYICITIYIYKYTICTTVHSKGAKGFLGTILKICHTKRQDAGNRLFVFSGG